MKLRFDPVAVVGLIAAGVALAFLIGLLRYLSR